MTRDDFEEWLEDHKDEALALVEGESMSTKKWVTLFGKALQRMRDEEESTGDDEDDEGGDVLDFFGDDE